MKRHLLFSSLILLVVSGVAGCASEEKVDPRLEKAVMNQNNAMRDRNQAERGNVNMNRDAAPNQTK